MSARLFLDTNVIVYAYDTADPEKQAKAQTLLTMSAARRDGAVSTQVLGEFFHSVVVRRRLMDASEALRIIEALKAGFFVADVTVDLVEEAIEVHRRFQLRYWDSLIVATARSLGCEEIASEDFNDRQDYGGVRVSNPFAS